MLTIDDLMQTNVLMQRILEDVKTEHVPEHAREYEFVPYPYEFDIRNFRWSFYRAKPFWMRQPPDYTPELQPVFSMQRTVWTDGRLFAFVWICVIEDEKIVTYRIVPIKRYMAEEHVMTYGAKGIIDRRIAP